MAVVGLQGIAVMDHGTEKVKNHCSMVPAIAHGNHANMAWHYKITVVQRQKSPIKSSLAHTKEIKISP